MCIEGDVRLGVGNLTGFYASINDVEDYYFIKNELARGRVEVFVDRTYGTILCDDFWDYQEASVVSMSTTWFLFTWLMMNTCLYIAVYHHHYARE